MPPKQKPDEVDLTDTLTFLRMANDSTIKELVELACNGRSTPVSGDAIRVYQKLA